MSKQSFLQESPDFSLVLGGPLYQLYRRTKLAGPPLDLLRRRIIVITSIVWLPLLLLSAIGGHVAGAGVSFLYDIETHSRFLIALPGTILSREVVQPEIEGPEMIGIQRAEYTVGVAGCEKRHTYIAVCPEGERVVLQRAPVGFCESNRSLDREDKPMNTFKQIVIIAALLAVGCASSKITDQDKLTRKIQRPDTMWFYDFAATPADVPADSVLAGHPSVQAAPQTPEQIAEGRKLGAEIATELVEQVRSMGLPAEHASTETKPMINDVVVRGYLLSIQEGSEAERVGIGFGEGASELKAAAEGFQVTSQGLRKLGSGTDEAGGSKSPGAALGVVGLAATANPAGLIISGGMKVYGEESGSSKVEGRAKQIAKDIAGQIKQRAQEQGWISPSQ